MLITRGRELTARLRTCLRSFARARRDKNRGAKFSSVSFTDSAERTRVGFGRSFLFRACCFSELIAMERIMGDVFHRSQFETIHGIQRAVFLGSYETTCIDMRRSGVRDDGTIEGDNNFFG
jgi:hypothetical protein